MKKFIGLRAKTYGYLKFENYKTSLEATQLENKISHLEKKLN